MPFCKFLFLSILLFTSNAFSQEKVYIVDGDTIHIGSNKYRFSGIDTPEMKQKGIICRSWPCGPQAMVQPGAWVQALGQGPARSMGPGPGPRYLQPA